jgi:hypothetical protein
MEKAERPHQLIKDAGIAADGHSFPLGAADPLIEQMHSVAGTDIKIDVVSAAIVPCK